MVIGPQKKVLWHLSIEENLLGSVCVVFGEEFFKNEIEKNVGCIGCRQLCVLYVSFCLCNLCLPPTHCPPSPRQTAIPLKFGDRTA